MVSAQSATERDRAGRTRWPVLSASLAAASGILAALAYIAVELADWRRGGLLAVAAAFACAFAAMLRMFAPVRCAAWLDERASMLLLLPAVVASAIVAVAAEPDVMEHQWWWLGLWLAAVALVPVVCGLRIDPRASARFVGNHRIEIAVVAALVALATAARFVRLDTLPEPYSGDEALFALSALSVTEGDATNPFRFGPQSAPTLYLYYLGAFDRVLGLSPEIARASSAVLGIAAVIVTYFFLRELFNRTVAVCGALFLAAYHFHLQFGRESMPNIIDPVLIPLVLLFTYRAIRDGRRLDYAMAGLALGLTIYAWVSARLIPLEVAALVGWWVIAKRSMPANWLQGVIVASAAVFIAAAPLALHAYRNPDGFNARVKVVSIFEAKPDGVSTWYEAERDRGRSPAGIMWKQARGSVETVFFTKDQYIFYGADVPLIGTGVLAPLLIGIGWAMWRVREPRYLLLLVMLVAPIVTGGMLTVPPSGNAASSARLLGIIPAVSGLVAVGAERIGVLAGRRDRSFQLAAALVVVIAVSIMSLNFYFRLYDSKGYTDGVTREIDEFSRSIRANVPAGTELHFLQGGRWHMGHAALAFGLRDYVVLEVDESGNPIKIHNPLTSTPGPIGILFTAQRVHDVSLVMRNCPDGELRRLSPPSVPTAASSAVYLVEAPPITSGVHPCLRP